MKAMSCRSSVMTSVRGARTLLTSPQGFTALLTRGKAQVAPSVEESEEITLEQAMPFESIPGPVSLPLIGSMYKYLPGGEFSHLRDSPFDLLEHKFKKYGKIFREQVRPGYEIVGVLDPAHFRQANRLGMAEKYPTRTLSNFEFLLKQRTKRKVPFGIVLTNGEEWYRMRRQLQKEMMRASSIALYLPAQEQVAQDFITRLRKLRNANGEVPDLLQELYKWAMESVGVMCFDARLGAVDPDLRVSETAERFIKATNDIFKYLHELFFDIFRTYRYYETPSFKKLDQAYCISWKIAEQYMQEMLARHREGKEGLVKNRDNLMLSLLSKPELSTEEATMFAFDLFSAAVDTTGHTMSFNMIQLSRHPEVQERLRDEVMRVVPPGSSVTEKEINQLKYLKAVMKETFRVMPTTNLNAKVFSNDVVIAGYRIPAGVDVLMFNNLTSMNPEYVDDPDVYRPERWLRDYGGRAMEPAIVMPFGHGPRMCLGRRIAEQEIYLGLIKLMQNYRIEYHHPEPINQLMRMINKPDRPLNFKFVDL